MQKHVNPFMDRGRHSSQLQYFKLKAKAQKNASKKFLYICKNVFYMP